MEAWPFGSLNGGVGLAVPRPNWFELTSIITGFGDLAGTTQEHIA